MLKNMSSMEVTEWLAFFKWKEMKQDQGSPDTSSNTPQSLLQQRFDALSGNESRQMDNSIRYDEPPPAYLFGDDEPEE